MLLTGVQPARIDLTDSEAGTRKVTLCSNVQRYSDTSMQFLRSVVHTGHSREQHMCGQRNAGARLQDEDQDLIVLRLRIAVQHQRHRPLHPVPEGRKETGSRLTDGQRQTASFDLDRA